MRLDPPPSVQIDIYDEQVLLTCRVSGAWRSYPVAPEAVAAALAGLPLGSGLLPPNTLAWGMAGGEPYLVQLIPPAVAELPLRAGGTVTTYTIPLPPLVWAGCGADYRLWALNVADWPATDAPLCRAPFPNSYADGKICWGSADRPPAMTGPAALAVALRGFLESEFSLHVDNHKSKKYPSSVVVLWRDLGAGDGPTPSGYPLDDLIPTESRLGWLVAGGPWGGGGR